MSFHELERPIGQHRKRDEETSKQHPKPVWMSIGVAVTMLPPGIYDVAYLVGLLHTPVLLVNWRSHVVDGRSVLCDQWSAQNVCHASASTAAERLSMCDRRRCGAPTELRTRRSLSFVWPSPFPTRAGGGLVVHTCLLLAVRGPWASALMRLCWCQAARGRRSLASAWNARHQLELVNCFLLCIDGWTRNTCDGRLRPDHIMRSGEGGRRRSCLHPKRTTDGIAPPLLSGFPKTGQGGAATVRKGLTAAWLPRHSDWLVVPPLPRPTCGGGRSGPARSLQRVGSPSALP